MKQAGNRRIIAITGTVWTGRKTAPRRLLVRDGFLRPTWFTTARPFSDARFERISLGSFHLAQARHEVLAHMKYGRSFLGIMAGEFQRALSSSRLGVLIVGPQEVVAQVAEKEASMRVFVLKDSHMDLSHHLKPVERSGQLQRINVDIAVPGAWDRAYHEIRAELGLSRLSASGVSFAP